MNTDKLFAESIANEYAPKDTSKVVALKKLDRKAKSKANIFGYTFGIGMDEALIALLEVKDPEYITVKEICAKAGVNRSTFYLHYETIADLMNEAAETVDKQFLSYFAKDANDFAEQIDSREQKELILVTQDYLHPYLQFIRDHKKVYRVSFRNPGNLKAEEKFRDLKRYVLEPILARFKVPEEYRPYYIAYYINGVIAIVREWLDRDCNEPIETVAAIIEECVRPSGGAEGKAYGK